MASLESPALEEEAFTQPRGIAVASASSSLPATSAHQQALLTRGPVARTLLGFALPILGSTLLQSLTASVNSVWIGHFLGERALAATSNATLILFLLLNAVFGLSMAATIMVGQSLGASRVDEARRVVGSGIGFFGVISVSTAVVGYLSTPLLLRLLGTPADVMPDAIIYLRIIFTALPSIYFYSFFMQALRGAGDAKTPLLFMALSVLLDAGLNPLFIFGLGPFPKLGIAGAAVATLIADTAALLALLATLQRRRHILWIGRRDIALLRPDRAIIGTLVAKGMPMGLQMIVYSTASLAMVKLVNAHGSIMVAAYGASMQLWAYVLMPAQAIGAAVSSMVAQNIGAQRWDRVARITGVGVVYNFLLGGTLIGLLYFGNRAALELFLPAGAEALGAAVHLNAIIIWSLSFYGVNFVLFGAVRATGAVWPPIAILVVTMCLVRPGFAVLLQPAWGVDAIWWSFPVSYVLSMSLAIAYFRRGRWQRATMGPRAHSDLAVDGVG